MINTQRISSDHIAIFYTNNALHTPLLRKSLSYYKKVLLFDNISKTLGVIISSKPIDFVDFGDTAIKLIAPKSIQNLGHLSIIKKLAYVLDHSECKFVSLFEHDVLYPNDYLNTIQGFIKYFSFQEFDYLAYGNLIGVNKTGYLKRKIIDYPMSTLTFKYEVLKNLLYEKEKECIENGGWCFIEPGYSGSAGGNLIRVNLCSMSNYPLVHVNMDKTFFNHHISNHYLTFEETSNHGFNQWPGNLIHIFQ